MRFTIASGTSPLDGFTIKRGVGIGGFGEVYFAVSDSGKEVALKRIARNLDVELRGVRQCLNLKHANLIGLWDIKKDHVGESWVVMEFVSGPSLRDEILANENGLPMDDVIWWFQGIFAGVHYLHQNGIVHRDLKPGNIFQDNEAQLVKIGDYGLSKFISGSKRSGHTESVGTVHYMAPEIGLGIYGREIDVYSLGVMLYELITGKVPFDGESTQEIIMKHMTAQPDVSILPIKFQHVVKNCLVKDPEKRYDSVLSMVKDLPSEFMPPSLRRSVSYLEDTDHYNKETGQAAQLTDKSDEETSSPTTQKLTAPENDLVTQKDSNQPPTVNADSPIVFSQHNVAGSGSGTSPLPVTSTHGPSPTAHVSPPIPPQPVSSTARPSRFNQRPGESQWNPNTPSIANNHTINPHVDSVPGISTGDVQTDQSIHTKFDSIGQSVVFGDIVHHNSPSPHQPFSQNGTASGAGPAVHSNTTGSAASTVPAGQQIVTARLVVPQTPPLPGKPNQQVGRNRNRQRLTATARHQLNQSETFLDAAKKLLHMTPGVTQLSRLTGGWLICAVIIFFIFISGALLSFGRDIAYPFQGNQTPNSYVFVSSTPDIVSAFLWFGTVTFACNALLLSLTRFWGPNPRVTYSKMLSVIAVVIVTALFAAGLQSWLDAPVHRLGYSSLLFRGALADLLFDWRLSPVVGIREWTPTVFGYIVYFAGVLILFPSWSVLSPLRNRRLDLLLVFYGVFLGVVFSIFVNFHVVCSGLFGLSLGICSQIGSYWLPDSQRLQVQTQSQSA